MKKILKNFLKKIADENKKSFGTKKLDCCDLNKPKGVTQKTKNNI